MFSDPPTLCNEIRFKMMGLPYCDITCIPAPPLGSVPAMVRTTGGLGVCGDIFSQ